MSSLFAAVRRILPARVQKGFVGYDLQGNSYFELPNPAGGRMKRTVEYKVNRELSEYTRGEHRPPVQWRAWLSHTRDQPPSMQELEKDVNRQSALQPKIAAIEAREREERIRQGYLLPDGSVPEAAPQVAGPSTPTERRARVERIGQSASNPSVSDRTPAPAASTGGRGTTYEVPTPNRSDLAPPRATIDPTKASAEELRKLAEEDTKRRIAQSEKAGVDVPGPGPGRNGSFSAEQAQNSGTGSGTGGLQPRRRGKK